MIDPIDEYIIDLDIDIIQGKSKFILNKYLFYF